MEKKMLFNFHTHTTFSDGKNTPEEIVNYAIEKGFKTLGFSDHAFTKHDQRYCMKEEKGYILEINRLKKKYADQLQIYLGVEEDASQPTNRNFFDYIIGSLHYLKFDNKNHIMDSTYGYYTDCARYYGNDIVMAQAYYDRFISYIQARKPDIVGHFDLITKFDETEKERFLKNERYWEIAEAAVLKAVKSDCIFEVNTGLMTRNYRTNPCPHERLLKIIAKNGGRITLSSDAHQAQNLCAYFDEMKIMLRSIGFDGVYVLYDGQWQKMNLEKK